MAAARGGDLPAVAGTTAASSRPRDGYAGEQTLEERLYRLAPEFDFFQTVRILEHLAPERVTVGRDGPVTSEAVRFRVHNITSFPPSALFELERPKVDAPIPVLTLNFMGLTGPVGVMPRHYTQLLERVLRERDNPARYVLRDWMDLFNHRMISLFYRAWAKYTFWMGFDRSEHLRADPDAFTQALYSLVGMGTPGLRHRLRVAAREQHEGQPRERVLSRINDLMLLYFGGIMAHRPRCADMLRGMLEEYFSIPVRVLQFQGQWLQLDPENRTHLGSENGNNELGATSVVGSRVWDIESKLRIRLGPVRYDQFLHFLPDWTALPRGKGLFMLMHLVRLYIGPEFDVDVQLVLQREEVPECRLPESTSDGAQLGWNTWLRSQAVVRDAVDAVFPGEEVVWVGEASAAMEG